jgi:hypothetical protein
MKVKRAVKSKDPREAEKAVSNNRGRGEADPQEELVEDLQEDLQEDSQDDAEDPVDVIDGEQVEVEPDFDEAFDLSQESAEEDAGVEEIPLTVSLQ